MLLQHNRCLGRFFYYNYRDALERIKYGEPELVALLRTLKTTTAELEENLEEERRYLEESSTAVDEEVAISAEYVTLLEKLAIAKSNSDAAKIHHDSLDQGSKVSEQEANLIKSRYRSTFARLELMVEQVATFEDEHQIGDRWTPDDPRYIQGIKNVTIRRYHLALSKLEHLVVQRLLELTKLNASGVGN
jgi:hypothetical protein